MYFTVIKFIGTYICEMHVTIDMQSLSIKYIILRVAKFEASNNFHLT